MSDRTTASRSLLGHTFEGRLRVDQWRFQVGRCCEYHWLRIHVGPFIWRWSI